MLSHYNSILMKLSLKFIITLFSIGIINNLISQNIQPTSSSDISKSNKTYQINYTNWEKLLQKHVSNEGFVDYKGFVEDKEQLFNFTQHLLQNTPQKQWTNNQKKAYLINAYNAFTIQLVVKHYPVDSIKDIGGFLTSVFKIDFINFNGEMIALDDIEKGMLLPMGDPRVHFAVNCASFSCPKLSSTAYYPKSLDQQLDKAAKDFINSQRNIISKNQAKLSKLFKWYKSDFEKENQSLIDFINLYSNIKLQNNTSIEYLDYNWQLNSVENANKG